MVENNSCSLTNNDKDCLETLLAICTLTTKDKSVEISELRSYVNMDTLHKMGELGLVLRQPTEHGIYYSVTQSGLNFYDRLEGYVKDILNLTSEADYQPPTSTSRPSRVIIREG